MKAISFAKLFAVSVLLFVMLSGCVSTRSPDSSVALAAPVETWPAPCASSLSQEIISQMQDPVRGRGKLILNGAWQFSPTWSGPQQRFSATLPVPGTWKTSNLLPSPSNNRFDRLARGFYQKQLSIPADWNQSRLILDLQRISTDARVYVDGKPAGTLSFPNAKLDLTTALANKSQCNIVIEVGAARDEEEALRQLAVKDDLTAVYSDDDSYQLKGLIGDVTLEAKPQGNCIEDVAIRTSVRKGLFVTEVTLADEPTAPTRVLAEIKDEGSNQTVKQFSCTVLPSSSKKLVCAWSWPDAKLWQPGSPHLYKLRLKTKSFGLNDQVEASFGFREFWIQGKQFFLNNKAINLRPCTATIMGYTDVSGDAATVGGVIDGLMKAGFNCQEMWPVNSDVRGKVSLCRWWYNEADKKGWLVIAAAPDARPYVNTWPAKRNDFVRFVDLGVSPEKNHPSIIMWTTSGNLFVTKVMDDPDWLGRTGTENKVSPVYQDVSLIIKERARDRPVFSHNGGVCGDVYSENNYLCLTPLQEREEWLRPWAANSTRPYMAVEFGTPFNCTMLRGRTEFEKAIVTEPLMTEYSAVYLGEKAYRSETDQYRQDIASRYNPVTRQYQPWQAVPSLNFAPAFQELQSLFSRNTWRSWRAIGITGGMIPWDLGYGWQLLTAPMPPYTVSQGSGEGLIGPFRKSIDNRWLYYLQERGGWKVTPAGQAMMTSNGPYLAYVAHKGDGADLLKKDHHYRSGETLQKQIVVLNDSLKDCPYSLKWSVVEGKKILATGSLVGTAPTGKRLLLPFQCKLPVVSAKTDCQILLNGSINTQPLPEDSFQLRVYPPPTAGASSVTLDDPLGDSRKYLETLNYTCLSPGPASKVVVVGRNALSSGKVSLDSYKAFVEKGGVLILLGQQPDWWTKKGLRVCPQVTRRVFPVQAGGSELKLDSEDLRDWNGAGSLIPTNLVLGELPMPAHGWHRSNQGSVSSACIEKPHHGSWRPLLESQFDLAYSPLLVNRWGKGHVIVCSLDFEERGASDPAAELCMRNLLSYAGNLKPAQFLPAAVLGSENDLKFYSSLGLDLVATVDKGGPVIVGPSASAAQIATAKNLLAKGRSVFCQGQATGSLTGLKLKVTSDQPFANTPAASGSQFCQGVSISDLHARAAYPITVIDTGSDKTSSGIFAQSTVGPGKLYACQLFPPDVPVTVRPYLRFTAWRQTRCVSQLLSNIGAEFRPEVSIFGPRANTFYCSDYIPPDKNNFALSDDPYRYYHW